jgi:hypothetical protein
LIFHVQNIGISYRNGMLKRYLRIVCKIGISYCFRYEILIQFHLGILKCFKNDSDQIEIILNKSGVANPNRSLGRIWENFQKY